VGHSGDLVHLDGIALERGNYGQQEKMRVPSLWKGLLTDDL
jgi:hypothetical protein